MTGGVKLRLTATLALVAITAAAFLIITLSGSADAAALGMGFIPARLAVEAPWPALPVWLTPLSATLVLAGGLHLIMNLLLLAWCGREVERMRVDSVWRGGNILTVDPARPRASALAVLGDRIVAVGDDADLDGLTADRTVEQPRDDLRPATGDRRHTPVHHRQPRRRHHLPCRLAHQRRRRVAVPG